MDYIKNVRPADLLFLDKSLSNLFFLPNYDQEVREKWLNTERSATLLLFFAFFREMLNKKTSKKESIINLHNGGKSVAEIQQVLLLLFPNDRIPSGAVSE